MRTPKSLEYPTSRNFDYFDTQFVLLSFTVAKLYWLQTDILDYNIVDRYITKQTSFYLKKYN